MITTNGRPAASGKGRLITLWILSGLVALVFIGAGGAKSAGTAVMVELFAKVGLGPWFRYFTGLLEKAAGMSVPISRYAFHAAVLLAIVAPVTVLGSSLIVPVVRPHRDHRLFAKGLNMNQQETKT